VKLRRSCGRLNQGKLHQAEFALHKSGNPEVLATAQVIITGYRAIRRQQPATGKHTQPEPEETRAGDGAKLDDLSSSELDHVYLAEERLNCIGRP
jgi:hypothetical protein